MHFLKKVELPKLKFSIKKFLNIITFIYLRFFLYIYKSNYSFTFSLDIKGF